MQVTDEFLNSFKIKLPFTLKRVDEKLYDVLSDELFCQLFWMKYFKFSWAPLFEKQQRISRINEFDLTLPIYIDVETRLIERLPNFVKSSLYFGHAFSFPPSESLIPLNGGIVYCIGIVMIILAFVICLITNKNLL